MGQYLCVITIYMYAVKGFWALWDNICVITIAMHAVKGFWALRDNIYVLLPFTCMLLRDSPYGTIFMCYYHLHVCC
jgi:hypothetical protein